MLCSKGHNQSEIARILQVGVATISRDVHYIQQDLYKEFGEQIFVEYLGKANLSQEQVENITEHETIYYNKERRRRLLFASYLGARMLHEI
jgi:transposase